VVVRFKEYTHLGALDEHTNKRRKLPFMERCAGESKNILYILCNENENENEREENASAPRT
jgi:hypothetical protein